MFLNHEVFKKGLSEIVLAFRLDLTEEEVITWYKYTKNLSDEEFMGKVKNCILTCKHKPYISDLLNAEYEKNNSYYKPFEFDERGGNDE